MIDYHTPRINFLAPIRPLESSTRVRVLKVIDYLRMSGEIAELVQYGDNVNSSDCNILVVQKWSHLPIINLVKTLKQQGVITVYDMVDKLPDGEILAIVDKIIVDCSAIEEWCKSLVPNKNLDITIIPDSVDYIDEPIPRKPIKKTDVLDLVFFASPSNLNCVDVCREALIQLAKEKTYTLTYISGSPKPECFKGLDAKYIQWSPYTFSMNLRKFDLAILPQKIDKGDAKMVQAITHGIPTVATNMESYRNIALQTNTTEFLCSTINDWHDALTNMFDPETRRIFLDKTVDWTWKNYNIKQIISEYKKFFSRLLREKYLE